MNRRPRRAVRPVLDRLDDRCLLSGLSPSQVTAAYGLNAVTFNVGGKSIKGDGTGQAIAVIDAYHDPYLVSDLHTFDQTYHLPDPSLGVIDQAGTATDDGWAQEEMMDVEWAHAIAPGATIVVVEARSDSIPDLMAAVAKARSIPGVSVASMSWGGSEFSGQNAYDSQFTTPAGHNGITFVAAAGDAGASGGAQWPASSPNVLGVGGTTLQVGTAGSYVGESLWSDSSGGNSGFESEPPYQSASQSTGRRSTPDVAFDGDPNSGVAVYSTAPSTGRGSWAQVGGTSLGAPAWAGIVAIADQGRVLAGKGTLDGASQTLPALYALPSSDFHQVASLTTATGFGGGFFGGFRRFRGGGFQTNTVTAGLGTPNGAALINGLAFGTSSASATRAAATRAASTAITTPAAAVTTSGPVGTTNPPASARFGGTVWGWPYTATLPVFFFSGRTSPAQSAGTLLSRGTRISDLWGSLLGAFGQG